MGIQYMLLCEQNLSQLPWGREHFRVSSPCALPGMDYDAPPVENWGLSPPPLASGQACDTMGLPRLGHHRDAVSLELSVTLALGTQSPWCEEAKAATFRGHGQAS